MLSKCCILMKLLKIVILTPPMNSGLTSKRFGLSYFYGDVRLECEINNSRT